MVFSQIRMAIGPELRTPSEPLTRIIRAFRFTVLSLSKVRMERKLVIPLKPRRIEHLPTEHELCKEKLKFASIHIKA